MYFFLGFFVVLSVLFLLLTVFRIRRVRRKICAMDACEKSRLLHALAEPFGFAYCREQDFFTSRTDAWQRDLGYCSLYDRLAPHAQLIFQCEPVYFNACGCTWLLELWKGQYGISTGAEAGLYRAYSVVNPKSYDTALFHAVTDEWMPDFSLELWKGEKLLLQRAGTHWWLTGFLPGCFSRPADLCLRVSVTFPHPEMQEAFTKALLERGYPGSAASICCDTVSITFCEPLSPQPCERIPIICRFSQWKNRLFCRIYRFVTRPFCRSDDRLLCLYYFLPFAFRRSLQICKPKRYGLYS